MQQFGHLAVHPDRALALVFRLLESFDHRAGPDEVRLAGAEYRIAGIDLRRVYQALAVEAEHQPLPRFRFEQGEVAEFVAHAVEDGNTLRARGDRKSVV